MGCSTKNGERRTGKDQTKGSADGGGVAADGRGADGGRTRTPTRGSAHNLYACKTKYGGIDVSEAQEAKRLPDENARLNKLVVDLSLDKDGLQSVIRKNDCGSER